MCYLEFMRFRIFFCRASREKTNLGKGWKIWHVKFRIANTLDVDSLCVFVDGGDEVLRVLRGYKLDANSIFLE